MRIDAPNHIDENNDSITKLNIVTVISTFVDIYYSYKISLIITIPDILLVKNLRKKNNCILNAVYDVYNIYTVYGFDKINIPAHVIYTI